MGKVSVVSVTNWVVIFGTGASVIPLRQVPHPNGERVTACWPFQKFETQGSVARFIFKVGSKGSGEKREKTKYLLHLR